jgi:hypothetical protein
VENLPKLFMYGAALAFVIALVVAFTGPLVGIPAEGFSRACTNLALLGIGWVLVFKGDSA